MSEEALKEIDKQIISWIEQLDNLYSERASIATRINDIENRLSLLKQARRALAAEWGATSDEVPIPLQYTSEGVREAIHEVFRRPDERLLVGEIVRRLLEQGYDFGDKNPRRVVNMALINDPDVDMEHGIYNLTSELPF